MNDLLIKIARERFSNPNTQFVPFVEDTNANNLLLDINNHPHAFVLACLMDRRIKAERAWIIPYEVFRTLNAYSIHELAEVDVDKYKRLFQNNNLHHFNELMSAIFYQAVIFIKNKYGGDASKIWSNMPSSSSVVYRFLEFTGSGRKIATMAANILARRFRIPFSDYFSIDISTDVHIVRVMKRFGYVPADADNEMIIYKARELNPDFPGIIDFSCWEIGRTWCRPQNSDCDNCPVSSECKKCF
jgi:endonuclease-3